ncbi:uncharacterized protein LOC125894961 isoform X5 [Xyrichtys novacula]|uniref:Uncharacterized protein LOC125894961 isoform X5 n=1 Tax=Xyrichtys novacula TaxID=13765 RepID=A0AAV1FBQ7_XYRNO|nr:uncharacterized protein LOC125894961 isoform X5 [Xyrichtys novacula]
MRAVFGLLAMMLGVCHGVETTCDGRHDGTECYGALRGTVILQLMDDATEIFRYYWMKESTIILHGGKHRILTNQIANRSSFTPSNGTIRINNLNRNDSGDYTLKIFNSTGQRIERRTLQLIIQAPLSSVKLVPECLSHGEMRVSCSSGGGDSPQYNWTMDGHTLMDSQPLSEHEETNIITLKQDMSGRLVCTVRNNVSEVSDKTYISTCGVETSCDGRHDGAECYGALRGTVILQLMDDATEIFRYQWMNESTTILHWRENRILTNQIAKRSSFTPNNGTLRINNLSRNDGGNYTLKIFNSTGQSIERRTLQLIIQAPLSSVQLVPECLSQGEMRVSCSSGGGDSPQYNWTLDGHTLIDTQLLSEHEETNIITLKQDMSGRLVCTVRNNVSEVSDETFISTCGVETSCDGRHDGAECYGALRGTVILQLMDDATEIFRYQWIKETRTTLHWRENMIVINQIANRSSFTPNNGTLRINNLNRNDSGNYTLKIFDSTGQSIEKRTLQLIIQAPLSSVQLVPECLSHGEMRVSCSSSGGDSPQYNWTLDGHTLMDSQLLSEHEETNIITLKQDMSGRLVCTVRNNVSEVSNKTFISTCGYISVKCIQRNGNYVLETSETQCTTTTTTTTTTTSLGGKETDTTLTTKPSNNVTASNHTEGSSHRGDLWSTQVKVYLLVMVGVLSSLLVFLAVGMGVVWSQSKTQNKAEDVRGDQDLTYAEVNIVPRQGRQVQPEVEIEVEYGQVRFAQRPQQPVEPPGENSLYAKVHKSR